MRCDGELCRNREDVIPASFMEETVLTPSLKRMRKRLGCDDEVRRGGTSSDREVA